MLKNNKRSKIRSNGGLVLPRYTTPLIGDNEDVDSDGVLMDDSTSEKNMKTVGKGANAFDKQIAQIIVSQLRNANIAALIVTTVAWAVTFIILLVYHFGSKDHRLISDITQNFRRFGGTDSLSLGQFIHDPSTFVRSGYAILIPALVFCFIPALFHLIIVVSRGTFEWYIAYAVNNSYNSLRWMQYALSYGMISWIVFQFSGVTDVILLCFMVFVKICIYATLWIHETINQKRRGKTINWEPLSLAIILFSLLGAITIPYFLVQMCSAPSPILSNTPWFMWFFVGGALLSCLIGGFIVLTHYAGRNGASDQRNNANYELRFIIHSIISNLYFAVILCLATIISAP